MTLSLTAQKNTDTLLTQSESYKYSFLNENFIMKPYTFEDYLNSTFEDYLNIKEPFIIRSRNGHHPLFVIDGVISNHDTLGLNPNDIKSISVRKDDRTIKLYGGNSTDGVILITTKRGQTKVQRY